MTTLLFVAPNSNLDTKDEFMRIVSGYTPTPVVGMISRDSLSLGLKSIAADAVHFAGHGGKSVLELSDGLIDASDLLSMLDQQRHAKFVFLNTCNSLSIGTTIHNGLHIPIIAHDAEINDPAAIRFAERYYREYKRTGDVQKSFDAAKETLLRLFPSQAVIPQLINGDMGTREDYDRCMQYLTKELEGVFKHFNERLDNQDAAIAEIRTAVEKQNQAPGKVVVIGLTLLALLVVLQGLTPILNGMLVH